MSDILLSILPLSLFASIENKCLLVDEGDTTPGILSVSCTQSVNVVKCNACKM